MKTDKYAHIPEENKNGHCFRDALEFALFDSSLFDESESSIMIVHGLVDGQGPLTGMTIVHGWCELNGIVIDPSQAMVVPMEEYYRIGKITTVFKYSVKEAASKALESGHYGYWEQELDCGEFCHAD